MNQPTPFTNSTSGTDPATDTAGASSSTPLTSPAGTSGALSSGVSSGSALSSRSAGASSGYGDATAASGSGQAQGNRRETLHRWAGVAHQAIDKVEQKLSSVGGGSGGVGSLKSKLSGEGGYREQARQYGGQMRERVREQPLQTAAIVFASGVIYSKLFMGRKRKQVELVEVKAYLPDRHASLGERTRRFMDSSDETMHRLADSGHARAKKLGATTMMGAAGAKAMTSRLLHDTRKAMPSAKQVRKKSHEYGSMARYQVQEHPLIGVALAVGIGALMVSLAMRREDHSMRR